MTWDNPPEPTENELEQHEQERAAQAPTVRIEGLSAKAVRGIVLGAVRERCDYSAAIEQVQKEAISNAIKEIVTQESRAQIAAAVAKALEEGWQEHSRYGEPTGKLITLRERIASVLTDKYRDNGAGYHSPEDTFVGHAIRKVIADQFATAFKAELESAKQALRAQVDSLIKAKLTETLRDALGLR